MAGLTSNTIPKATATATVQNSLLTDDATTLAYNTDKFTVAASTGNTAIAGTLGVTGAVTATSVSTGTSPPSLTPGTAGFTGYGEGTAPSAAAGVDVIYADSTAHRAKLSNNNGSFSNIVTAASSDTLTNKIVSLTAAHGTDDTYEGIQIVGLNAGASISQWEAVYLGSSSTWLLADANGSGTYPALGLATAAYSNTNPAAILVQGTVRNDAFNFTPGGLLYLSGSVGAITQTPPASSGDKVQVIGYALTADIIYVTFDLTYLTVT